MQNNSKSFEWIPLSESDLKKKVNVREGETKVGQRIKVDVQNESAIRYVIIGICEDIGPQTNGGFPGSDKAYEAFLTYFVNVQSNEFLNGDAILILGHIQPLVDFKNQQQGFELVEELDNFVQEILTPYITKNYIPIVIGGGHNNAFPLIKTVSQYLQIPIKVVNLDPHADFRALEGRHSGNPFSYAFEQNWMHHYAVMGLHQSYNSQYLLDELRNNKCTFTFWDDYVSGKANFEQDLKRISKEIQTDYFGLELDMDSIADMPVSAYTPSGVSLELARKYVMTMANSPKVKYFHLPEASPKDEIAKVGKALTYLVTDFIKTRDLVEFN